MATPKDLMQLLNYIKNSAGPRFTGIGLIMYQGKANSLPIVALRLPRRGLLLPKIDHIAVEELLLKISSEDNKYHDGFHLLNENLELTHLSQYVAPPIIKKILVGKLAGGSRFRTALYSSLLPNVICTGIVSKGGEINLFIKGKKYATLK